MKYFYFTIRREKRIGLDVTVSLLKVTHYGTFSGFAIAMFENGLKTDTKYDILFCKEIEEEEFDDLRYFGVLGVNE